MVFGLDKLRKSSRDERDEMNSQGHDQDNQETFHDHESHDQDKGLKGKLNQWSRRRSSAGNTDMNDMKGNDMRGNDMRGGMTGGMTGDKGDMDTGNRKRVMSGMKDDMEEREESFGTSGFGGTKYRQDKDEDFSANTEGFGSERF